jgi:hypothetical protein
VARAVELPLRIPAGPVTVGVRPYLTSGLKLELDRDLRAIFGAGTSRGSARGTLSAESGVAIDVGFATQVFTENARDAEGKLDRGSAQNAFHMALEATKEQLGAEGMAMLARAVGGTDKVSAVLRTFVEAAVTKQKIERESSQTFLTR